MLRLLRFRVTSFRSVRDSGWIDTDDVTALIGINESGKTNLLLPLWKLNPAKDGEISPIADYPRSDFSQLRLSKGDQVFITALFSPDEDLLTDLVELTGLPPAQFETVSVQRRFNGKYVIGFPDAGPEAAIDAQEALAVLDGTRAALTSGDGDAVLRATMTAALEEARANVGPSLDARSAELVTRSLAKVQLLDEDESELAEAWRALDASIASLAARLHSAHPNHNQKARELVLAQLPKFVYYSNYGNLDSEIYLPHVIDNMEREGLGAKEAARARTLKVLFDFVKLEPQDILDLGRAVSKAQGKAPTPEEIEEAAHRTRERSVLLQSAGTLLTKSFRAWWKQGDYRFRFEADGDHFRIWVSDDKRPEEIELESRSTGLQWFLSFFLVFLVESTGDHANSILLLDEPGLTLHPLAQEDLAVFFDSLAETNQLLYTTHSPHLLDANAPDRIRNVYVDTSGATVVSADLRAGAKAASAQSRSVYAVHAALGLSVSASLLQGCNIVLVEGTSDQFYFTAMKVLLLAQGKIKPKREILFAPCSGAKGIIAAIPLVTARDEAPPYVIVDADGPGRQVAQTLRSGAIYGGDNKSRIISIAELLPDIEAAEVEDLLPRGTMVSAASRMLHHEEEDFADSVTDGKALVPQIEAFADRLGIAPVTGWKVELARTVKQRLLKQPKEATDQLDLWTKLFKQLA